MAVKKRAREDQDEDIRSDGTDEPADLVDLRGKLGMKGKIGESAFRTAINLQKRAQARNEFLRKFEQTYGVRSGVHLMERVVRVERKRAESTGIDKYKLSPEEIHAVIRDEFTGAELKAAKDRVSIPNRRTKSAKQIEEEALAEIAPPPPGTS